MTIGSTGSQPWRGRWLSLVFAVLAFLAPAIVFAADIPPLSGRIVDQAGLLDGATRGDLEGKLADLEAKSGIQLVVATVKSLGGEEIEPYANQMFRTWKLGQKERNNGVLLLVAPAERRVRIEVGYGLEGTLTDALSQVIISNAITPRFKAGDFSGGIVRGVDDIITVLTTDASEWQKRPSLRVDQASSSEAPVNWLAVAGILLFLFLMMVSRSFRMLVFAMLLSRGGSGGRGGFGGGYGRSGGGGFSGGGGSSGGGGASGRW